MYTGFCMAGFLPRSTNVERAVDDQWKSWGKILRLVVRFVQWRDNEYQLIGGTLCQELDFREQLTERRLITLEVNPQVRFR